MKKLVIFSVTALAAAVMSGTPSMTSQAAMYTYGMPSGAYSGSGCGSDSSNGSLGGFYGNSCTGNNYGSGGGCDAGSSCDTGSSRNAGSSRNVGSSRNAGGDCVTGNNCAPGGQDCDPNSCVIFDGTGTGSGALLEAIKPQVGEVLSGVNWEQEHGGQILPGQPNQPGGDDQSTPNQPGGGDQSTPNQPGGGDQTLPNQPGGGDQTLPNQPGGDGQLTPDQPGSEDAFVEQVLELVNEERAKAGAPALTLDSQAGEAAQVRAQEIQSSFSHTRPDGSSFSTALTEAGIRYSASGENIAYGQNSPQAVMEGWMNSSGHRANILNSNFTSIGIGHIRSSQGVDYWTQLFFR